MGYSIETAFFCADYYANYEIPGSKGQVYQVTLNGGEAPAFCTCPAYKFSKDQNCKHITYIWDHACLYNPQWKDPGPRTIKPVSYNLNLILGKECPGCKGPMIAVRIAV